MVYIHAEAPRSQSLNQTCTRTHMQKKEKETQMQEYADRLMHMQLE